jgi:outer membrane biogenesis lipoprotein LolB
MARLLRTIFLGILSCLLVACSTPETEHRPGEDPDLPATTGQLSTVTTGGTAGSMTAGATGGTGP